MIIKNKVILPLTVPFLLALLFIAACSPLPNTNYNGSVTTSRTNGKVTNIKVTYANGFVINARNKTEVDDAVLHLERTIKDLKSNREEMDD